MYSFVIHDGKKLYFVSDNFAEKPLFYVKKDDKFFLEQSLLIKKFKVKKFLQMK